jgi:hypothetical protein
MSTDRCLQYVAAMAVRPVLNVAAPGDDVASNDTTRHRRTTSAVVSSVVARRSDSTDNKLTTLALSFRQSSISFMKDRVKLKIRLMTLHGDLRPNDSL